MGKLIVAYTRESWGPSVSHAYPETDFQGMTQPSKIPKLKNLNPQDKLESRQQFLTNFDWTDLMLQQDEFNRKEIPFVESHNVFAIHRFDIGGNEEFMVRFTPKVNSPA